MCTAQDTSYCYSTRLLLIHAPKFEFCAVLTFTIKAAGAFKLGQVIFLKAPRVFKHEADFPRGVAVRGDPRAEQSKESTFPYDLVIALFVLALTCCPSRHASASPSHYHAPRNPQRHQQLCIHLPYLFSVLPTTRKQICAREHSPHQSSACHISSPRPRIPFAPVPQM